MMAKDALKEIIARKKERVALSKQQLPEDELKIRVQSLSAARPFTKAIRKPHIISLIAEIKKASPSFGIIREDFSIPAIVNAYRDAEVQAISVLTEEDYFQGNLSYISEVRNLIEVPVLRKDFIFEPYQVYESRFYGADAVLLIADILTQDAISELMGIASGLGMDCLVEVHEERELKKVLKLKGVQLVGINNRDLHTLQVDPKTVEKLITLIPKDKVVVVESGIKSHQDVLFYKILGVSAVLIGEAFMESPDIRKRVEEIMG
jgi:indole-3-glycerol phosphate synthase